MRTCNHVRDVPHRSPSLTVAKPGVAASSRSSVEVSPVWIAVTTATACFSSVPKYSIIELRPSCSYCHRQQPVGRV